MQTVLSKKFIGIGFFVGLMLAVMGLMLFATLGQNQANASSHNTGPSSKASFTHADVNLVQEIDIDALDIWVEITDDDIGDNDGICEGAIFDNQDGEDEFALGGCMQEGPMDALSHSAWSVLQTSIKMPKHKDISIDVSFECGNFFDTQVKSKGGQKDSASAASTVRVAVLVDDGVTTRTAFPALRSDLGADLTGDGNADQDDDLIATLASGVVFCHKSQLLEATFQGLIQDGDPFFPWEVTADFGADEDLVGTLWPDEESCKEVGDAGNDGAGGDENTCLEADFEVVGTCLIQLEDGQIVLLTACLAPEELRLVTGSMTANAFNFLYHNAQESSVHTITVIACTLDS